MEHTTNELADAFELVVVMNRLDLQDALFELRQRKAYPDNQDAGAQKQLDAAIALAQTVMGIKDI